MNTSIVLAFNTENDCILANNYLKDENINCKVTGNQLSFFWIYNDLAKRILNEHNITFVEMPFIITFTEKLESLV